MSAYENKVIVIGATGYIGSHLVERLLKDNYEVLLVDNNSTGRYTNIKHLYPRDKIPEVMNIDNLKAYPKIPIVFHLGTPSYYMFFEKNPHLYSYTIKDFLTILNYCKQWGSKLVYASTASMYWGNAIPFKETMNIYPKDLYSECFYQIERLCNLYSTYGVKSIGLRLFNVYGGRETFKEDNASIIHRFITSIGKNKTPILYGDGRQTRDFIYIDDVVESLMLSMKSKISCDVINIGSGTNYSFNEILELINTLMNVDMELVYRNNPIGNYIEHSLADISKANKLLKFTPKIDIETGIKSVIENQIYNGLFDEESEE